MSVIVSLMGGLGFFLYGMKLMSEGLQKVAGSKMRSILEVFTKNRVIGLLVGIFFTALIQSSNATTVMVVSFVNSGLMKLAQAPGIILGANIGTTVTGQLIAFDLADIAPLFVIIGVYVRKEQSDDQPSRRGYLGIWYSVYGYLRYLRSPERSKRDPGSRQRPRIPDESVSCILSRLGGYRDSAE